MVGGQDSGDAEWVKVNKVFEFLRLALRAWLLFLFSQSVLALDRQHPDG